MPTPDGPRSPLGAAPTIYDVARLAGVNPSTVSRALNSPGRVNAKTEARVREAAEELRYRTNPLARALQSGRTNALGLILLDITNPIIAGIMRGTQLIAEHGYTLILGESQNSGAVERVAAEKMLPSVDGLILAATRLQDADLAELNQQRPLVLINREVPGVASIHGPVEPGFDEAVAHLHLLGHRRIVYLSGPKDAWMSRQRTEILQEVGARRGVEIEVVGPNEPTLENGMRALTTLVAHDATAAITYNDMMAIGLLQAARKQGLEVPRDLSIIGFDDIFGSDFTCPPLTTIRVPATHLGELAVRRLLSIIEGTEPPSDDDAPATSLTVRESTGRPRSR